MDVSIQEHGGGYLLTLRHLLDCDPSDAWQLLATNPGLLTWFPELRLVPDGDRQLLLFVDGDSWQEMDVLTYVPLREFTFPWDKATVRIMISPAAEGVELSFIESIPPGFGQGPADAERDMTRWVLRMERIAHILGGAVPWARSARQQVAA